MSERKYREEIVRYGRMLHERGFVAAMDGNLSVRLDGDRILVTPTCVSKGAMRPADLVVVDTQGKRVAGRRNVTSEIGMHVLIYRMRPDVQAIVHAHPPTATGFAAAGHGADRAAGLRSGDGPGMHSAGAIWHAGNVGIGTDAGAVRARITMPF